jgi:hypothetical protein
VLSSLSSGRRELEKDILEIDFIGPDIGNR